jgi:hypothetical protein
MATFGGKMRKLRKKRNSLVRNDPVFFFTFWRIFATWRPKKNGKNRFLLCIVKIRQKFEKKLIVLEKSPNFLNHKTDWNLFYKKNIIIKNYHK